MEINFENTLSLLKSTPPALNALLRDLREDWVRTPETAESWSAGDVLAHLIHAEREDWIPRARFLLEHGDSRPFPPFDRWGYIVESRTKPVTALLDEFAEERARSLQALSDLHLQPTDLARRGLHPGLGTVTLGHLLATWPAHDLNHIHQLARILANLLRNPVGPFHRYLGVMQCDAHGA